MLGLTLPTAGQSNGFVINNADATADRSFAIDSGVNALIATVNPRFVIEHANALRFNTVLPPPDALSTLIQQVDTRFVIQYANADRMYQLSYPVALVGDQIAPQVSNLTVSILPLNAVKLTWTTDEFATHTVEYGSQPGIYTHTLADGLLYQQHEVTLTNLPGGVTYYRFRTADRSSNTFQSPEYTVTTQSMTFLPLVRR